MNTLYKEFRLSIQISISGELRLFRIQYNVIGCPLYSFELTNTKLVEPIGAQYRKLT